MVTLEAKVPSAARASGVPLEAGILLPVMMSTSLEVSWLATMVPARRAGAVSVREALALSRSWAVWRTLGQMGAGGIAGTLGRVRRREQHG